MDYLIVKWLHILSSTFLFGTGVGSAFYLLFVTLTRNVQAVAAVTRVVVVADWLFTSTTMLFQPLSGWWLVQRVGLPWGSRWLAWSIVLYLVGLACWLPVVWLQLRMRALANVAAQQQQALPPAYWRCFRAWILLGIPAFLAFVAVFYLMVVKPP